jgi:hypothetical protein
LAYDSNESGRFEIYVQPFPDGGPKWQVSTAEGFNPRWSPTGKELFYRLGDALMAVAVTPGVEFRSTSPRRIIEGRYENDDFAVSPTGDRFLMMPLIPTEAVPRQINLVSNWTLTLRERVLTAR